MDDENRYSNVDNAKKRVNNYNNNIINKNINYYNFFFN